MVKSWWNNIKKFTFKTTFGLVFWTNVTKTAKTSHPTRNHHESCMLINYNLFINYTWEERQKTKSLCFFFLIRLKSPMVKTVLNETKRKLLSICNNNNGILNKNVIINVISCCLHVSWLMGSISVPAVNDYSYILI